MYCFSKFCRLCLTSNDTLIDYNNIADEFVQKLQFILPTMRFSSEHEFLTMICTKCQNNLYKSYEFIENTLKSQQHLLNYWTKIYPLKSENNFKALRNKLFNENDVENTKEHKSTDTEFFELNNLIEIVNEPIESKPLILFAPHTSEQITPEEIISDKTTTENNTQSIIMSEEIITPIQFEHITVKQEIEEIYVQSQLEQSHLIDSTFNILENVKQTDEDKTDIKESSANINSFLLPEKSRLKYEFTYDNYEKWCCEKNVQNHIADENILLTYFEELAQNRKSSSLWSYYSMIRSVLSIKKNVDISKHVHLLGFLKRKSQGYKAKKSRILTKDDVAKFLTEADDDKYLMIKVILTIGLSGACRREELKNILVEHVKDEGQVFRFVIPNTKTKNAREFFVTPGDIEGLNLVEIVRKYYAMRPNNTDHSRFFVSYRNQKCTKQPVGIHTFGSTPKIIATFLNLSNPEEYTGHCFRRSSSSLLRFGSRPLNN